MDTTIQRLGQQVPALAINAIVLLAVVVTFLKYMASEAKANREARVAEQLVNNQLLARMHEDCQRSSTLGREAVEKNTVSNFEVSANVRALVKAIEDSGRVTGPRT